MICMGIIRRNKNERGCEEMNPHFFTAPLFFAFIWFRVQGSGVRWRLRRFLYWGDARKWHLSHQSLLRYEGRNRLTCMVSDPSAQSSPILVLGVTHRVFSSAQDDDTRGRKGSHLGDTLRVLELSVLYTIRVGPWRRKSRRGTSEFGLIQRGA